MTEQTAHTSDYTLNITPETEQDSVEKNRALMNLFRTIDIRLGGSSVRVELEEEDYRVAFNMALQTYRGASTNSVNTTFAFLFAAKNQQKYVLHNSIDNIVSMYRSRSLVGLGGSGTGLDYFGQVLANTLYPSGVARSVIGQSGLVSMEAIMQYEELLARMFARDFRFDYRPESNVLILHQVPKNDEIILFKAMTLKTITELLANHWANLWLTNWTLSECKIILGNKRGKFPTMPGAQGGAQVRASELIQEGLDAQEKLMQQIADYQDGGAPAGPTIF